MTPEELLEFLTNTPNNGTNWKEAIQELWETAYDEGDAAGFNKGYHMAKEVYL